jgi:hypothetical protein
MVATLPEDEPQPTEAEVRRDKLEAAARMVIAGHPQGAVRRIILYVVLVSCIGLLYALGGVPAAAGALVGSLIAALLLALTDNLA